MRKFILGLGALIVLVVAGVAVYLETADFNTWRGPIAAEVERVTGRKLTIAGDLKLDILTLTPAVVAADIRLANAEWGSRPDMIRVERFEAVVELLPLLTGKIVVRHVVLVAPDILLETNADDVGNWVFSPPGKSGTKDESGPAFATLPVVKEVRIRDARLAWRDGRTGRLVQARAKRIVIRSAGPASPVRAEIVGDLGGTPLEIDARLGSIEALLAGRKPWPVAFEARFGSSRLTGKGTIEPQRTPVRLRFALDAKRLALEELGGGAGASTARLFSDKPLPLAMLSALDVKLTVKVERITGAGPHLRGFSANLDVGGGRLSLHPIRARLGEGDLEATVTLVRRGDGAALSVKIALTKGKLGVITQELTGTATLTGPVQVRANLRGTGASTAAIMATLDGHVTVIAGRGKLHNKLFDFLSADVLKAITPWAPAEAPTEVVCGIVRFDIARGIARSRVLMLDTTRATVVGDGRINLKSEAINLLFEPTTKDLSLLSVAALVPIRVTGTLADPRFAPDLGAAVTGAAKSAIGGVTDAAKWLGAELGLSKGPKKQAPPCVAARAKAGLKTAAAPAPKPAASKKTAKPKPKKKEGVFDKIKGLFD